MSEHQASRTLLKSPPELWAECSDAQSLARHLDDFFGDIRITRLEPEQAVAWEGERVSGTVKLEPSGWGTKVTLTATAPVSETKKAPVPDPPQPVAAEPGPAAVVAEARPEPARMGFIGRVRYLFSAPPPPPPRRVAEPAAPPGPEAPVPLPEPVTPAATAEPPKADAALKAALESLGKAHHRPFSRG
jgi:hypothetical protein